jgi:hypothetical protein
MCSVGEGRSLKEYPSKLAPPLLMYRFQRIDLATSPHPPHVPNQKERSKLGLVHLMYYIQKIAFEINCERSHVLVRT